MELNAPQAEAVACTRGPLLVFAGAGSGKTRVITYRVANLIASDGVLPYRVLAVTFTNKAAAEMRSRLSALMGPELAAGVWVGTFHATCARILRTHAAAAGLKSGFVIYDSADQKALVSRCLKALNLDDEQFPPRAVLGRIHKEKQEGRGPDDMALNTHGDHTVRKLYEAYEEALAAANAVDFEDLILRVVRILEAPERSAVKDPIFETPERFVNEAMVEAKRALIMKFDHVLVDEFQDTNSIQYRMVRALASRTRNLCVVGDDDQSIYKWRGADVRNIRGFQKDYPDATVVKLEENYRSSKNIVTAALGVIQPSAQRVPKELFTNNDAGTKVAVLATADERDEAAQEVRMVREAESTGVSKKEIAVLYRIHAQSRVLEEALRAANIDYVIVGGMRFYERAEVKDALSYLRVLVNPKSDVDFLRVVNVPPRGIGDVTIDKLSTFARDERLSLAEACARADEIDALANSAKKRLADVAKLLAKLSSHVDRDSPEELVDAVLTQSGYLAWLKDEDNAEADARAENLRELSGSVKDYTVEAEARGEEPSLAGFLERVSLVSDTDQVGDTARLTLMTVHGAKGLEFELVVLTGMEQDMFPYKSRDNDRDMEEERRLAYVAVTRAKKHLVLTYARQRQIFGQTRLGVPSSFLADIPEEAVDFHATPDARRLGEQQQRYIDRDASDYGGDQFGQRHGSWRPQPAGARRGTGTNSVPESARVPPSSRYPGRPGPRSDRPAAPAPVSRYAERAPGERYVERELDEYAAQEMLRRGASVHHAQFGDGRVVALTSVGTEPAAVVDFPGWGEKKVLARFLRPGQAD